MHPGLSFLLAMMQATHEKCWKKALEHLLRNVAQYSICLTAPGYCNLELNLQKRLCKNRVAVAANRPSGVQVTAARGRELCSHGRHWPNRKMPSFFL